jgi:carbon monoxide dehydrogenase subunit G
MHFEGMLSIQAPRAKVWDYLTDPEKVSKSAPGLESLEIVEPGKKFRATTSIGFGSVKVRFVNDVEWVELDPPHRAWTRRRPWR